MRKRFLASGAMIAGMVASLTLSGGMYDSPWSLYSLEDSPVWKRQRCEENYWAMVRKYNR